MNEASGPLATLRAPEQALLSKNQWALCAEFENDNDFKALKNYRSELYSRLGKKRDAAMDLMDALLCQQNARSVTELSEQPQFKRQYASVTDAIHAVSEQQDSLKELLKTRGLSSTPKLLLNGEGYKVLIVDTTPDPHPHAKFLVDRTYIHDASNQVTGKPINIGLQYSAVVGATEDPSWVSPICLDRVPSQESPTQFGMQQAMAVCSQTTEACLVLLDSAYNNTPCRKITKACKANAIVIVRSACNRGYYLPAVKKERKGRGAQPKYGEKLNLYEPEKGAPADTKIMITPNDKRGHLRIYYWRKTYTKMAGMNGYEDPSAVVVVFEHRADGSLKYNNPLVVRVFVPEKSLFKGGEGSWLYFLRFPVERFFATGKRHLMLGRFQSPEMAHQQTFSLMTSLAYQQLYLAKMSGAIEWTIKPWHRYPKSDPKGEKLIPSHVQKGYSSILKTVGTPSVFRPATHIPPGRQVGQTQKRRQPQPVIRKSSSSKRSVLEGVSTAPSMNGKIRKAAAQMAAKVIHKTVETVIQQASNFIIFFALLLFFQGGFTDGKESVHSLCFGQNIILTAFEWRAGRSDGGVNAPNMDLLLTKPLPEERGPPGIG